MERSKFKNYFTGRINMIWISLLYFFCNWNLLRYFPYIFSVVRPAEISLDRQEDHIDLEFMAVWINLIILRVVWLFIWHMLLTALLTYAYAAGPFNNLSVWVIQLVQELIIWVRRSQAIRCLNCFQLPIDFYFMCLYHYSSNTSLNQCTEVLMGLKITAGKAIWIQV